VQSDLVGFGTSGEVLFRNDARAAESIQKPTVRLPQGRAFRAPSKLSKRMDNNDGTDDANKQKENLDASEILYNRRNNKNKDKDAGEIQETAETSSFVSKRNNINNNEKNGNGYDYPAPEQKGYDYPPPTGYSYLPPQQGYSYPKGQQNGKVEKKKPFLQEPQPFSIRVAEQETESEVFATTFATFETTSTRKPGVGKSLEQIETTTSTTSKPQLTKSTASSTSTTSRRGSTTYASSLKAVGEKTESVRSRVQTVNSVVNNNNNLKSTTPGYDSQKINTYTTARKPNGKTKETPFYTPTIPTIQTTTAKILSTENPPTTVTTPVPETSTNPTNSEIVKHALEMMESLKDLDMEDVIPTEAERYMGQRLGLEVPPSSGPNALHSLALYFANTDVNNTKRMTKEQAAQLKGISSVFLSNKTQTKYESLFPNEGRPTEASTSLPLTTSTTTRYSQDVDNDLEGQHSKHPILSAAGTPQLREIAQVFTHALSAYLQDPEQFRKILSEIRPTEPPNVEFNEIPRFQGEKEFVRQESAYNHPRQTATTGRPEDLEIFDYSDVTVPPKTQDEETTTESNEILITTDSSFITTTSYPETLPPTSTNLAEKTPASRLITENLEKNANSRTAKQFEDILSLPAGEINRNLDGNVKYSLDDSRENDDTSYFPEDRGNKSKLAPYGFGVKPENSTPINDPYPTSLADTQAVPLRWGDEITTTNDPTVELNEYPTVYPELLPPYDINGTEVFNTPSNGLQLPNEETDEHLQQAQSQSFVSSRNNNIYSDEKKNSKTYNDYLSYNEEFLLGTTNYGERLATTTEIPQTTSIRGHFVTKSVPKTTTEVPEYTTTDFPSTTASYTETFKTTLPDNEIINTDSKTTLSYSVFLDPLTINDGLMESDEDLITPSPNTYLPRNELLTSTEEIDQTSFAVTASSTSTTLNQRRGKSSIETTPLNIRFNDDETNTIEPMQKRANEMFGNLNETQVSHLMNVMKKADENRTVRRLILLLIQTCDGDDHNKTLEASRTALLNALIGMDSEQDRNEIRIINTRREKSLRTTTLAPIPITTYRSPNHEKYTSSESVSKEFEELEATSLPLEQSTYFIPQSSVNEYTTLDYQSQTTEQEIPTTTELPTTTIIVTTSTTTKQPILDSNNRLTDSSPRFRQKASNARFQKSLGSNSEYQSEPSNTLEHKKEDARALELLRSLYSLASRWGKK